MPAYKVTLSRSYVVEVNACDPHTARECAQVYVGYGDLSTEKERTDSGFEIRSIDMLENDVVDVEPV